MPGARFAISSVAVLLVVAALIGVRDHRQSASSGQAVALHPGAAALADPSLAVPKASVLPALKTASTDAAFANEAKCKSGADSTTVTSCVAGDTTSPKLTIALIGDSFAGEWSSALAKIADDQHWKLVTLIHDSCPWTAVAVVRPGTTRPYSQCQLWGQRALKDLLTVVKPDVAIVSFHPSASVPSHKTYDVTSQKLIANGMVTYWTQLANAGIHVVGISPTPYFGINAPQCIASHPTSIKSCGVPLSKTAPPANAIKLAAAALGPTKATFIDMNSLICGPTTCLPEVGNVVVYRDQKHLSKTYSLTLAPFLEAKLLKIEPM